MSVYMVIDLNAVCRFCLNVSETLTSIFDETNEQNVFALKVYELTGIQIKDEEKLPSRTCDQCRSQIEHFYAFKNMILESHSTLSEKELFLVKSENINEEETKQFTTPKQDEKFKIIPDHQNLQLNVKKENSGKDSPSESGCIEYPTLLTALKNDQCLLCLQQFSEKSSLRDHVDAHIAGTSLDPYYLVSDKDIFCHACDKNFDYRFNYIEHQRLHLNIKPFTCTYENCGLSFHSRTTLKQHLPLHANRTFMCAACGQGFKRKCDLASHEIIHLDEGRLFTCSVCYKQFKNRITLKAHCKMHDKHPKHKCPNCTKKYYSRSELSRHMLSHSKEKLFGCKICKRAYFSKSALARHLRETCNIITTQSPQSPE